MSPDGKLQFKNQIEEKEAILRKFLNDDQIAATKKTPREWSKETIIKRFKTKICPRSSWIQVS